MKIETVLIEKPKNASLILGQAHFIKTVEDLHEALVTSVPAIRFGVAFCEASGPCLVRASGNDQKLSRLAAENAYRLSAGHVFVILMEDAFPINVLGAVKAVQEVCSVFCASSNPVEVLVAQTKLGRGVVGVIDGLPSRGIETASQAAERRHFLRNIGYKA